MVSLWWDVSTSTRVVVGPLHVLSESLLGVSACGQGEF